VWHRPTEDLGHLAHRVEVAFRVQAAAVDNGSFRAARRRARPGGCPVRAFPS